MISAKSAILNQRLNLARVFAFKRQPVFAASYLVNLSQRMYHENVIDHFEKPRNVGSLNAKDQDVGTGLVGAPACGDVMKLQIKVNKDTNKIEKAVFKVSDILQAFFYTRIYRLLDEEVRSLVHHTQLKYSMEWILMKL